MREIRVIHDSPAAGVWNMAVDEALLETAAISGMATLRFYQWSEPTLSLGYFQSAIGRDQHAASRNCPLVRRPSGGGAILHDRELTYSIAMPQTSARLSEAKALDELFHETLIATLAELGVSAALFRATASCRSESVPGASKDTFLCFQRRTCLDVVCQSVKIAGSAQRRRRGAILQHGSILLAKSRFAPELPGIQELTGSCIDPPELAVRWTTHLQRCLLATFTAASLTPAEEGRARQLVGGRFASPEYLHRR
jgi:lipoate-protein ligase A